MHMLITEALSEPLAELMCSDLCLPTNQSTMSPLQISLLGQTIDKKLCSECTTSDEPSFLTWSEGVKAVFSSGKQGANIHTFTISH